jgi:hypothetical protein
LLALGLALRNPQQRKYPAKILGLVIPPIMFALADEVIYLAARNAL